MNGKILFLAAAFVLTGIGFAAEGNPPAAAPEKVTTAGAPAQEKVTTASTPAQEKVTTAGAPAQHKVATASTPAQEKVTTAIAPAPEKVVTTAKTVTTEKTVVTEKTVTTEKEQTGIVRPRIAVFKFTTIDIQGQHLRDFTDRTVPVTPQNSLSAAELGAVDEVMMGYVKLVDAEEERARRAHDRERLDAENDRNLARQQELADKLLKTHLRSVVIGAAFMEAALGNYDSVELVDNNEIYKAFRDMSARQAGEAPRSLPETLQIHGATHVLYGTVADLRVSGQTYSGYGVNTATLFYELDVMIKIVELKSNRVVFSGLFTGEDRELRLDGVQTVDSERFERLMKIAVAKAARAIDLKFDHQEKK